jgi:hypothetical protein
MTHTLVKMRVSQSTFNEIANDLRAAGYDHCFLRDGNIAMTGIALEVDNERPLPPGMVEVNAEDLPRSTFRDFYMIDQLGDLFGETNNEA